ncbi:hypothetical protein B0H14DRAFT_959806 [Mycena olivaceomarginata]|nr:hypothetical protein B0H14DRAFT_959806 [Mycena olivaceomarginata]
MEGIKLPLDENLWDALQIDDGPELEFLKSQTGIYDPDALKKHVMAVQAKAYEYFPYFCIISFSFARIRIHRLPAYPAVMSLVRERPDAIMLDLGSCCTHKLGLKLLDTYTSNLVGTDVRKVAADGYPLQNLLASDLRREFWDLGHELFQSTPGTFPVSFLAGDVFDPSFLTLAPVSTSASASSTPSPALSNLASLTTLNGQISILHASYFFHLFDEQKQTELAYLVAGLLCPLPGSMILGFHVGREKKGWRHDVIPRGQQMFCHSPESWIQLWEGIFPKGTVRVEAVLQKQGEYHPSLLVSEGPDDGVMVWSCIRL